MKILVLYQDYLSLLDDLIFYLNKNHIQADSFDIVNWRKLGNTNNRLPFLYRLLVPFLRIPGIHGILLKLLQKKLILKLAIKYDIVDIQYFGEEYDKLIPLFKASRKLVKITIWGSDFYRVNKERVEEQRRLFKYIDIIQLPTKRMKMDFLQKFSEFEKKIRIIHYGSAILDLIEELDKPDEISEYKKSLGIPDNKIILACGYNGSSGQRHKMIIEAITDLDESLKEKVFLVLPMTYGASDWYIVEIRDYLKRTGLPYAIFSKRMSECEVAKMRLVTDTAINIQITDAFSASIQEHIFAGNVLIVGDWLPYDYLIENNIYHLKTNLHDLNAKLSLILNDLVFHKEMSISNKEKIYNVSSWNSSITDWITAYQELLND